eukprot:GHVH01012110.1.p1 GENE.GHVH01012110.1~~GHVH01012110.1.p1  ORF type:complete len:529 (+),score=85.56 GHVH01012110.1:41-1627(+)
MNRYISTSTKLLDVISCHSDLPTPTSPKSKVLVLGTGWAAVAFLKGLKAPEKYDITVVSPERHFTCNPLFPSVVGGAIHEECARLDINKFIKGVQFICDSASAVDPHRKVVALSNGDEVAYDNLIYAVGTTNNTFGIPGVSEFCFFLKDWEDAKLLHGHVFRVLEDAKMRLPMKSDDEIRKMTHFAIIGGGATGTEVAAELVDCVNSDFPELKPYVNVTLIEMIDRLLPMYSNRTSEVTLNNLKASGLVNVLLKCAMSNRTKDTLTIRTADALPDSLRSLTVSTEATSDGYHEYIIHAPNVLWSSGVTQREVTKQLVKQQMSGTSGRPPPGVLTDENLKAKGFDGIYILGDNGVCLPNSINERSDEILELAKSKGSTLEATLHSLSRWFPQIPLAARSAEPFIDKDSINEVLKEMDSNFRSPPPTAQNANQQGQYLASVFNQHGPDHYASHAYRFVNKGSMCYIGNNRAILELDKELSRGLYGSFGTGAIWRVFYSMGQKTMPKKVTVLFDFARRAGARKMKLLSSYR